jgi:cysteinyl-tRNA synthetase
MLKVFNTLTRSKEEFHPLKEGKVGMYSCGPTVYDVPHLGNFRSFVMSDNIRRYLEYLGYEVKQVMNITDIDDKTIRGSGEEGVSLAEFTRRYEKSFFDGLRSLNVLPAHEYPRATENVDLMLGIVEDLEAKGFAYEADGSVYFSVSKFRDYGKLSGLDMSKIKIGATVEVDEYDKENPRDFALLKRSTESEVERGIYFESKWGKVRPGWHIECSALSMKHLGPTIDIHTGGVDLVFPHHENEIAQSEAHTGKPFVKYWIHGEHLMVNGEKMSKSLGNYVSLEDALKEHSSEVLRYMFVSTHYRKILDYTPDLARNAASNYERLMNAYENLLFALNTADKAEDPRMAEVLAELRQVEGEMRDAMDDDLNNPAAIGVFHKLARALNQYLLGGRSLAVLEAFREVFESFSGIFGLVFAAPPSLSEEHAQMVRQREAARSSKNWALADEIRSRLRGEGILLEDTDWGTKWSAE